MSTPQHHIIKETSDSITRLLQQEFKNSGYKRVHVIEEAPTSEAVDGKLPAVSVYLHQVTVDFDGTSGNIHQELVRVKDDDGNEREYSRMRRMWMRLDYLISTWAQTPEDEQLLLGLVIRTIMDNRSVPREKLKGKSFEDDFDLFLMMSARLDEGTLSRYWQNLQQPMRPALQVFTTVPIIPEALSPVTRVRERAIRFRDLNNPSEHELGPELNRFQQSDLNLEG